MGLAGRRVWEERFHPQRHVETLVRVDESLLRRPAAPAGGGAAPAPAARAG